MKDYNHKGCWMTAVISTLTICVLLGSCKSQEHVVTIVTHSTDTLRLTQVQRDSIYMHDSIHVSEKGDTVLIERWHTLWQDRWHSDTVYRARIDSVPTPYPVETVKEVEKPLTWWQRIRIYVGGVVIVGGVLAILIGWLGGTLRRKLGK